VADPLPHCAGFFGPVGIARVALSPRVGLPNPPTALWRLASPGFALHVPLPCCLVGGRPVVLDAAAEGLGGRFAIGGCRCHSSAPPAEQKDG
jgi:hypothetical protein